MSGYWWVGINGWLLVGGYGGWLLVAGLLLGGFTCGVAEVRIRW